jgi:hypothetical protein
LIPKESGFMRNDTNRWSPPSGLPAPFEAPGLSLSPAHLTRQSLISGPDVRRTSPAPLIGWPDIAPDAPYRITLRRDRVVEVNGAAGQEGWNSAKGEAFSDITDGWSVFDLTGPAAMDILKRGTEISLDTPSASVVRRMWGLDVWLYRFGHEDTFRLHIARAMDEALIGHIRAAAALSA